MICMQRSAQFHLEISGTHADVFELSYHIPHFVKVIACSLIGRTISVIDAAFLLFGPQRLQHPQILSAIQDIDISVDTPKN